MRLQLAALTCVLSIAFTSGFATGQTRAPDAPLTPIRFDVYVRSDRDSAERVEEYVAELKQKSKGLEIQVHDVLKSKSALIRLYELGKAAGREKPVLPAFHTCDRTYFGFLDAKRSGPEIEKLLTANLYTRSTCPRCQKLKAFLPTLQKRWPAIRFVTHDVDRSAAARSTWHELCRKAGSPPGLPTIDFARRIIVGYQGDNVTGAQFDQLIRDVSGSQRNESEKPVSYNATHSESNLLFASDAQMLQAYAPLAPLALLTTQDVADADQVADPDPIEDAAQDAFPMDLLELPDEADESEVGEAEIERESVQTDTIDVPYIGQINATDMGMPLFTLTVGLVDGFNPCAMWVLVFLLSVLVNIKDRRKILVIAGTFVLISGLAYLAFMAAWLNIFMLIGIARPVQVALGILAIVIGVINVKDFFAFKKGVSLSIPESQKPKLYKRVREIVSAKYLTAALTGAVVLAVIVNMIELLCTAGLPALYTQVLTMQDYPTWKNYAFLLLYIAAYMFDDTLLVAIVVTTLSHRKLQEREGRWLKLLSGLVILILGLVMLLRPEWLQIGS